MVEFECLCPIYASRRVLNNFASSVGVRVKRVCEGGGYSRAIGARVYMCTYDLP